MATLQNIRKRGPLLAIVVGLALAAFILGDFFSSGTSGLSDDQYEVGVVNGKSIDYRDYRQRIENLKQFIQITRRQDPDQRTMRQIEQDKWNEMVREKVLEDDFKELGLGVHADEVADMMYGRNIDPLVVNIVERLYQQKFNPALVIQILKNLDQDPTGEATKIWRYVEKDIYRRRKKQKYLNLVEKAMFVTQKEAANEYLEKNKRVDFKYVVKKYDEIDNESITVSDEDLKDYYEEHKNEYKIDEETRDVVYVTFDVIPTQADSIEEKNRTVKLKAKYAKTDNNEAFIRANSETSSYDPLHYTEENLPESIDSIMFNAEIGFIHGPYLEDGSYKLSKLLEVKQIADSMELRHILIQPNQNIQTLERAREIADSLKNLLQRDTSLFAGLALKHSVDASAQKGGYLGWLGEKDVVKGFRDTSFSASKGDVVVAQSQFGIHVIHVLDHTPKKRKVQVGTVVNKITPSDDTRKSVFKVASNFAYENSTPEKFDKAIKEMGLTKKVASNLRKMDYGIPGIENARNFVKGAYRAEVNQLLTEGLSESPVFSYDNRFVIGMLANIRKKGIAPLEQVKDEIKYRVINKKKGEMLVKQMQETMQSANSIEALAQSQNLSIDTAQNLSFAAFSLPGIGAEPKVIATATNIEQDKMTGPIEGENGVYVISVYSIREATLPENLTNYAQKLLRGKKTRASYQSYEALKQKAEIEDKRFKFE